METAWQTRQQAEAANSSLGACCSEGGGDGMSERQPGSACVTCVWGEGSEGSGGAARRWARPGVPCARVRMEAGVSEPVRWACHVQTGRVQGRG